MIRKIIKFMWLDRTKTDAIILMVIGSIMMIIGLLGMLGYLK